MQPLYCSFTVSIMLLMDVEHNCGRHLNLTVSLSPSLLRTHLHVVAFYFR